MAESIVQNTKPNCPNCGQLDASQKVSSIRSEGISGTAYSFESQQGTSLQGSSVSLTGLAAKLTPPSEPGLGCASDAWVGMIFIILSSIPVGVFRESILAGIIASIICIGVFVAFISWVKRVTEKFNKQHQIWKQINARYQQLFYCRRCDRVFIPGEFKSVPVDELASFISQGIQTRE